MTQQAKETFDKLNVALEKAQAWLADNYPEYERAFVQFVRQEEQKQGDLYYGLIGILIRVEHEGEQNFKEQLDRDYIQTDSVRQVVRRIIDTSASADSRIEAWEDLKELVEIK